MKTIEERAYIAVGHPLPSKGAMHVPEMLKFEERIYVNGYIKGATEQRKIDIDNAVTAYCACCYCGCEFDADKCDRLIDFRKELENTI